MSENVQEDQYSAFILGSNSLRPGHQGMVNTFVKEQFPQAKFKKIYDASIDGWKNTDFHRCCDKKGWTLTIVETTKNFIFGGFTTAEWESSYCISKPGPHSFLFSVNEGSKYPITSGDATAIECWSGVCARFGAWELVIASDSTNNTGSWCKANGASFKLPAAKGSQYPSINGGEEYFQLKQFEVYKVTVRITIIIIFRNNEWRD
jgi:hypothetical protein